MGDRLQFQSHQQGGICNQIELGWIFALQEERNRLLEVGNALEAEGDLAHPQSKVDSASR